jgi:hypothetical protein
LAASLPGAAPAPEGAPRRGRGQSRPRSATNPPRPRLAWCWRLLPH